jgi:hypothetical protein
MSGKHGLATRHTNWARNAEEPPPSAYPGIANDELVTLFDVKFPTVLTRPFACYMAQTWWMSFGPRSKSDHVITLEPFALTARARQESGDARLSVAERYESRDNYLAQVEASARDLARQRFLRAEDIRAIRARGALICDTVFPPAVPKRLTVNGARGPTVPDAMTVAGGHAMAPLREFHDNIDRQLWFPLSAYANGD